ncbi:hypothetical protein SAMN05216330_1129 [Bradyrhizobium sp. Ghvi]|nr:hypothetical protein SAMN05216330_1129 [Bradyrhizobium sp. Ghvi]
MRRLLPYLAAPAILGALALAAHLLWSSDHRRSALDADLFGFRLFDTGQQSTNFRMVSMPFGPRRSSLPSPALTAVI